MDLNSSGIENNINTGNYQAPAKEKKIKNVSPNDVQDLIETQDFY